MRNLLFSTLLLLAAACSKSPKGTLPENPEQPSEPKIQAALPKETKEESAPAKTSPPGVLPWVEDDYARALQLGKETHKPLFLEAWAPWCHTCLSMRNFVLSDPSLSVWTDRFVWLAVNVDKAESAPLSARFPTENIPTFFVLDSADETVAGRWVGAFSLGELREFLQDAEKSIRLAHAADAPANSEVVLLRRADLAAQSKRYADAADLYAQAVKRAPKDWPRRTEVLTSEMQALKLARAAETCHKRALAEIPALKHVSSTTDFVSYALSCTESLPKPRLKKLYDESVRKLAALAADNGAPLSADDRGDAYRQLREVYEKLEQPAAAREAMQKRLGVVEGAVAKAPNAHAASTFNGARTETLIYLGRAPEAVAFLKKSEADLPDDYNPPMRLAVAYLSLGQHEEALSAVDRSLAKAYGPRKGVVYGVKADIYEKWGKREPAQRVVEEQIAFYRALPEGQKRPQAEETAVGRLSKMTQAPEAKQ